MTIQSNALFVCDALTLLERLPSDETILLYLDPPWGTELGGRGSDKTEWGRYLANIVQQARRVLSNAGSLFVHCSQLSPIDLRLMVSQVFGKQPSFEITWHVKKSGRVGGYSTPRVDNEILLVYAKSNDPSYNSVSRPLSPEESSPYLMEDERGRFRTADLTVPGIGTAAQPLWRDYQPPPGRSWRFTADKLEALQLDNRIHFPAKGGSPRLKQYLDEHAGIEIGVTWDDVPALIAPTERTGLAGQRPLSLMERIIRMASNEGDRVFDPFCGSGTTLVAAHSLRRRWWGADNDPESCQLITARLAKTCALTESLDYAVFTETDIRGWPIVDATYRRVVETVEGITRLQQELSALTDHLISLKRLMNIGENEAEREDEAIAQMTRWISASIAKESKSVDSYIDTVRSWSANWDRLDRASQSFLPQAELLYESIAQTGGQDYSPFIIQYCRALENELLTKLFATYTRDLHARYPASTDVFLAKDLKNDKTAKFAKSLEKQQVTYTLGEMNFIMGLMKSGGQTLEASVVLQDFRSFVLQYFSERIVEKAYLDQIDRINQDFRCKAAHPYLLDAEVASRCRDQVRACLNELILSYRGVV